VEREKIRDEAKERREMREREFARELAQEQAEQTAMRDAIEGYLKEARKILGVAEPTAESSDPDEGEIKE
jgi:hypothetical protein